LKWSATSRLRINKRLHQKSSEDKPRLAF